MQFKISGSNVKDPINSGWDERQVVGYNHLQQPIFAPYQTATYSFNTLTQAEFAAWCSADDGAYHDVVIYSESGSTSACYSNCIVRRIAGQVGPGEKIYGAQFRIERLTL